MVLDVDRPHEVHLDVTRGYSPGVADGLPQELLFAFMRDVKKFPDIRFQFTLQARNPILVFLDTAGLHPFPSEAIITYGGRGLRAHRGDGEEHDE
jgi:hypothetical protein